MLIEGLKVETQNLMKENKQIQDRIKHVEEEFEDEREDESEIEGEETSSIHVPLEGLFSCMYCDHQCGIRKHFDDHTMTHEDTDNSNLDIKCSDCDYKCTKEVTIKKHMNRIHSDLQEKSDKNITLEISEENIKNKNEKEDKEYLEDVDDYFQIEIVDGETVYACIICDEGLDSVEEVRNHVKDEHREVVVM